MQRLFSTFANGWPGKGLFVLRFVLAAYLVHDCVAGFGHAAGIGPQFLRIVAAASGLFILAGLWTPITSALATLLEVWSAISMSGNTSSSILAAALGVGLALLGPGAFSIDSRRYGRRRISIGHR